MDMLNDFHFNLAQFCSTLRPFYDMSSHLTLVQDTSNNLQLFSISTINYFLKAKQKYNLNILIIVQIQIYTRRKLFPLTFIIIIFPPFVLLKGTTK